MLKIKKEFGKMNKMIKADIYFDGEYYCGKCIDFDIFTQGKTLDELAKNLKEAIKLHFEVGRNSCLKNSPLFRGKSSFLFWLVWIIKL